jgi:D-alanine-D-alanine ligase
MDKEYTKIFLKGINVKYLPYAVVNGVVDVQKVMKKLSYPVIVKPATLGSSIGIKIARTKEELKDGILFALRYSNKVIVEKYLQNNFEINCAVYREGAKIHVSECEQPVKQGELLGFDDKYVDGGRIFPANVAKEISDQIKKISRLVYEKSGANGIIRIDFLVSNDVVYVNEINGVPGSLAYYLFCETMSDFSKILTGLILTAEQNHAKEKSLVRKFSSSILNITGIKGSKHLKKP